MSNNIYSQLINRLQSGGSAVLLTQFSGTHGDSGQGLQKRLAEPSDEGVSLEALNSGLPVFRTQGDVSFAAEPFYPKERLLILGGGHIALPLAFFCSETGFSVTVVDDRPDFANTGRFPSAEAVVCESFKKAIEKFKITAADYVVIITRGHRHDQTCLETLLNGTEPRYTGMIGSRRRVAAVKEALISQGFDRERIERVHTPIGLAIGAVTPEEIAVSILAEIIACKRLKQENDIRLRGCSDVDFDVIRALASVGEPASVVTIVLAKGSVPRGAGAKMLVFPDGRIVGSIGGGCSEAAVIGNARAIIGTGHYRLQTVDMTGDAAEDEGMVCGGIIKVLIEDLSC